MMTSSKFNVTERGNPTEIIPDSPRPLILGCPQMSVDVPAAGFRHEQWAGDQNTGYFVQL